MTKLDRLLSPYICGSTYYWYTQMRIGNHELNGGVFSYKRAARLHLRIQLQRLIPNHSVLIEYLTLRHKLEAPANAH